MKRMIDDKKLKEISGGGLKLWSHMFTKNGTSYEVIMFTNKKVSELPSTVPCLPLSSGGPGRINIEYFTTILLNQGGAFLLYFDTSGEKPNISRLYLGDFTETITEFVE